MQATEIECGLWKLDKIENARNEIKQLTEMENKPIDTGSAIETVAKPVITIWRKERWNELKTKLD